MHPLRSNGIIGITKQQARKVATLGPDVASVGSRRKAVSLDHVKIQR
jgi:hypothetical protein